LRPAHRSIAITDRSSVGEARRAAIAAAATLGFDEARRSNVGILATELATNAVMHAQRGEFLVCPVALPGGGCLDLLALDNGPGIADIGRAMEDGFSSLGTPGHGLGAIQRISDSASLYSALGKGTVSWSRVVQGPGTWADATGVVNIPVAEETVCGDGFLVEHDGHRSLYMVVDGLGHGVGAAEAADEAVRIVREHAQQPLGEILERTHDALKKTRGAAMSLARADRKAATLTYAGIGNISAVLLGGMQSRSLVSQNGTLGAAMPRHTQEFVCALEAGAMLVMFSDGLTSKASPAGYAGFQRRPAALLAGLLYRDFSRRRDDATVLVTRPGADSQPQAGPEA
jgi:anti-sigma regulatory factor (Ser/Thr protein kinase)